MSVSKPKALTWRVTEIPTGTTKEQLVHFFEYEDRDRISVNSLCPDASGGNELTATLLYQPHPDRPDEGPKFTHGKPRDVSIDKDFEHWTPLYCPPAGTIIAADIIAITGLSGHAFGSWAYSEENMWLRDDVYKFAPNARILTYGYNTPLVGPNMSIVRMSDLSDTFYENLINMREDSKCEQRPIIFIGHSLGCMIIKKAMIIARERNVVSSRLPVRCIIFLAAPHRGMDVTALQNVVKNSPPEQLVEELRPESETLKLLNEGFSRTAQDIDILTCYETRPTKTMAFDEAKQKWTRSGESTMILDPSSANQYWPKEKRILADADHSSIAKLKKNKTIFSNVRAAISRALIPTAQISREERNNNAQGHNWAEAIPRSQSRASDGQDYWDTQQNQYRQSHVERINPRRSATGSSGHSSVSPPIYSPQPEERSAISHGGQPSWFPRAPESHDPRETQQEQYRRHFDRNPPEQYAKDLPYQDPSAWSTDMPLLGQRDTASNMTRPPFRGAYADFNRPQFPGSMTYSPTPEQNTQGANEFRNSVGYPEDAVEAARAGTYIPARFDEQQAQRELRDSPDLQNHDRSYALRSVFMEGRDSPSQAFGESALPQLASYRDRFNLSRGSKPSDADLYNQHDASFATRQSPHGSSPQLRSTEMMQEFEQIGQGPRDIDDSIARPHVPTLVTPPPSQPSLSQQLSLGRPGLSQHASMQQLRSAAAIQEFEQMSLEPSRRNDTFALLQPPTLVTPPPHQPGFGQLSVAHPELAHHASMQEIRSAATMQEPEKVDLQSDNKNDCLSPPSQPSDLVTPPKSITSDQALCTPGDSNKQIADPSFRPFESIKRPHKPPRFCDGCEEEVLGLDYHCLDCPNWNYCPECFESKLASHPKHEFQTIVPEGDSDDLEVNSTEDDEPDRLAQAECSRCKADIVSTDFFYQCPTCPLDHRVCEACQKDSKSCLECAMLCQRRQLIWYGKKLESNIWIDPNPDIQDSALVKALKSQDVDALDKLVHDQTLLKAVDADGRTPLHIAAHLNLDVGAKFLIMHGADLDVQDNLGRTPLSYAVLSKHEGLALSLLGRGADWGVVDHRGNNILHLASAAGCEEVVRVTFEAYDEEIESAFQYIDALNDANRTPLFRSCEVGNFKIAKLLLAEGADPNASDGNEASQMGELANSNHSEAVVFLLDHGAAVDSQDIVSRTALLRAATADNFELCETLMKRGADPNATARAGELGLLAAAAYAGALKTVETLLQGGAEIDGKDNRKRTALHRAAENNKVETCRCLLKHGAWLEALDDLGRTPLHMAALSGHLEASKFLLEFGAVADVRTNAGNTVVSLAAMNGHLDIVEYLLVTRKMPATPPSYVWARKWKNFSFSDSVNAQRKSTILALLRAHKHV